MAIVKKRAILRRVATTPTATYAYFWETSPYGAAVDVADIGNTLGTAYNEVGSLAMTTAPPSGVVVKATIEVEYEVPDP